MRISGWTVPHKRQRYNTAGDWKMRRHEFLITVSHMKNPDYCFLVFIHEAIEAWLCFRRGISEKDVTRFDRKYEDHREAGDDSEPGDDPKAPYRREHWFATKIERAIAKELEIDWGAYEEAIRSL